MVVTRYWRGRSRPQRLWCHGLVQRCLRRHAAAEFCLCAFESCRFPTSFFFNRRIRLAFATHERHTWHFICIRDTRPTFRMRAVHAKAYRCDSCLSMVLWFAHMRQGRRILTSIFLALCRFVFEAHDASARAGPSTDSFCLKGSPVGKFALQKEHRALTCGVAWHRRPKLKVSRAFAL